MTKAQQTLTLGLAVASVCTYGPTLRLRKLTTIQLYLVCFLGLVPFPSQVQDEIIPVVS